MEKATATNQEQKYESGSASVDTNPNLPYEPLTLTRGFKIPRIKREPADKLPSSDTSFLRVKTEYPNESVNKPHPQPVNKPKIKPVNIDSTVKREPISVIDGESNCVEVGTTRKRVIPDIKLKAEDLRNSCRQTYEEDINLEHVKSIVNVNTAADKTENYSFVDIDKTMLVGVAGKWEVLTHKCDQCEIVFTNKKRLKKHVKRSHNIKCPVCKEIYISKVKLLQHGKKHHFNVFCTACDKLLPNTQSLEQHCYIYHSHKCSLCHETFYIKRLLLEHWRKEHPTTCEKCHVQFTTQDQAMHHQRDAHFVSCDECRLSFPNIRTLNNHKRQNHIRPSNRSPAPTVENTVEEEIKCMCTECGIFYTDFLYLERHNQREHAN